MERQLTFSSIENSQAKRTTRRAKFLAMMNDAVPWKEICAEIEPYYYKNKVGRPARGLEKMLRMYLLQIWFNLSDEALEDAIYDSTAMKDFMGIDFFEEQVPDATTLLKFRRIIEDKELAGKILAAVNGVLESKGKIMHGGTSVDATIIDAPSSTKNKTGERDSEMHQTKKGGQYYFGMKAHIGVDAASGLVHTVKATAANESDISQTQNLVREDDEVVYGDSGYRGIEKREEIKSDGHLSKVDWRIAMMPGNSRN